MRIISIFVKKIYFNKELPNKKNIYKYDVGHLINCRNGFHEALMTYKTRKNSASVASIVLADIFIRVKVRVNQVITTGSNSPFQSEKHSPSK